MSGEQWTRWSVTSPVSDRGTEVEGLGCGGPGWKEVLVPTPKSQSVDRDTPISGVLTFMLSLDVRTISGTDSV